MDYPYIDGPDKHGYYKIYRTPDYSFIISGYELKIIHTILDGLFKDGDAVKLNQFNFNGLVTMDRDGIEVIQGWYGGFSVVRGLAEKLVKSKKTAGARAYICIGEYGEFSRPDPVDNDDDTDDDKTPACTLDAWGI